MPKQGKSISIEDDVQRSQQKPPGETHFERTRKETLPCPSVAPNQITKIEIRCTRNYVEVHVYSRRVPSHEIFVFWNAEDAVDFYRRIWLRRKEGGR